MAALTDAFYIGGTKNGALLGEALVIVNDVLKADFRYLIKQRGAMLAKGMVLGAQFEALFEDGLYFQLAAHANRLAARLREALGELGAVFSVDSPSNQLFIVLPAATVEALAKRYDFERWQLLADGRIVIRLVTSWATREDAVDALCRDLAALAVPVATCAL